MIKNEIKKVYCNSEVISQVICDRCGKDITNEIFYVATLYAVRTNDQKTLLERATCINDIFLNVCADCVESLKSFHEDVEEYIESIV